MSCVCFIQNDHAREYLDWLITVTLVKQEVEALNLDLSPYIEEADEWFETLPPSDTKDEGSNQIRKFAESQAKKFDMIPEEFLRAYGKIINEHNAYIRAYLETKMDGSIYDEIEETRVFKEEAHELLDSLYEENVTDIEVLID